MNAVTPDILLLVLGVVLLVADVMGPRGGSAALRNVLFHAAWIGLAAAFASTFFVAGPLPVMIGEIYRIDGFGLWMRRVLIISAFFAVVMARPYFTSGANGQAPMTHASEFTYILLFCTVGMFVVLSARDLLALFVGLELATVPLYILAGFNKRDSSSAEAGVKYIMTGSLSTAFMIFAFSYFYGLSGSIRLDALAEFASANAANPLLWVGVAFMLGAIGFKLAMAPFHMWAPDVYAGAPAPAAAFLSVSSKGIALAFLLMMIFGPFAALQEQMTRVFLVLAGATMVIGNLGALRQRQIRRFIAYSSIAQAGYLLMVFLGGAGMARTSALYYLLIYAAGNYAFFIVASIAGEKRGENFDALRGLSDASPALAAVLAVSMFSLAGIPPAAGFIGKFTIFAAAAENGHYGFVIFAALNSTVSLYYYLMVLREAYMVPAEAESTAPALTIRTSQRIALAVLTGATLLLGVLPGISTAIQRAVE